MLDSSVSPPDVMAKYRVIAVVGASKNPEKDAYTVPEYLKRAGYRVIPINPTADSILGEKAYPSLLGLPDEIAREVEVVDVFRPSEELPQVASQVAELKGRYGRPFVFWAQLGLRSEEAKKVLQAAGIDYVMDACMRTVHRLSRQK